MTECDSNKRHNIYRNLNSVPLNAIPLNDQKSMKLKIILWQILKKET